jgi:DNA-binding transcriptional regulator YiaG
MPSQRLAVHFNAASPLSNLNMPNIAAVLKTEISRIARKEARIETAALKKAAASHRSDIAEFKRRIQALEQQLRRSERTRPVAAAIAETDESPTKTRFSARSLASQRRRLGLSASDCGLLVGVSTQSIYNWEEGKARPQAKHLPALAALKNLGKKDAALHVASRKKAS